MSEWRGVCRSAVVGAAAWWASAAWAGSEPALVLSPCRLDGLSHEARCGELPRPLDPSQPQGRQIRLKVALLPALARHPRPDPVFFLAGGPGQSAIELAPQIEALLARVMNRRDIVLIDQRGTGQSAPLYCEPDQASPARPLAEQVDAARQAAQLSACLAQLQRLPHGDLRHYSTPVAVADAEAVRQALGLGPVNLVGGSYGTRVALDYLRQFPSGVRRVVLDGVAPPDMGLVRSMAADNEAALSAVFSGCERDAVCQRRWPDLRAQWLGLLRGLPRTVSLAHPLTGAPETLRLDRSTVLGLVRGPLYQPAMAAGLPAAIGDAAAGRFGPLVSLATVSAGSSRRPALAEGQHFSVLCSEDWPPTTAGPAETPLGFGREAERFYGEACAHWPRASLPTAFRQLPRAAAGVLLLSGGHDPVTPPHHAQRVAQALGPRAVHAVVPMAGHGLLGLGCVRDAVARFLDEADEARALAQAAESLRCAAGLPQPGAFLPAEPASASHAKAQP